MQLVQEAVNRLESSHAQTQLELHMLQMRPSGTVGNAPSAALRRANQVLLDSVKTCEQDNLAKAAMIEQLEASLDDVRSQVRACLSC